MTARRSIAPTCALAVFASSCLPTEVHYIELAQDSDGPSRSFLVQNRGSTGGGSGALGPIAGDIGLLRYDLSVQHRPFLLTGDLLAGISDGPFQRLSRMDPAADPPQLDSPIVSTKWDSFRVYDAGACSFLLGWSDLAPQIVTAIDAQFLHNAAVSNGHAVGTAAVTPHLRATGRLAGRDGIPLYQDLDSLRIVVTYQADRISDPTTEILDPICHFPPAYVHPGCDDLQVELDFELGLERVPGPIGFPARDPACEDDPPFTFPENTYVNDFRGVLRSVIVGVSQFGDEGACACTDQAKRAIRDAIASKLQEQVPDAVATQIRDLLRVQIGQLSLLPAQMVNCNCDADCRAAVAAGSPGYPADLRPRCDDITISNMPARVCLPQIEPDRVNVRPDGLEIVVSEGVDDFQNAWMQTQLPPGSCQAQRFSVDPGADPQAGTIEAVLVPRHGT